MRSPMYHLCKCRSRRGEVSESRAGRRAFIRRVEGLFRTFAGYIQFSLQLEFVFRNGVSENEFLSFRVRVQEPLYDGLPV
jgi:hypothetical protein